MLPSPPTHPPHSPDSVHSPGQGSKEKVRAGRGMWGCGLFSPSLSHSVSLSLLPSLRLPHPPFPPLFPLSCPAVPIIGEPAILYPHRGGGAGGESDG
ncbi:unnamed protein product [Closterium sp. NIES-65]|nr:unnamed protein product [Closterium sp. NIES-65]